MNGYWKKLFSHRVDRYFDPETVHKIELFINFLPCPFVLTSIVLSLTSKVIEFHDSREIKCFSSTISTVNQTSLCSQSGASLLYREKKKIHCCTFAVNCLAPTQICFVLETGDKWIFLLQITHLVLCVFDQSEVEKIAKKTKINW